MGANILKNEKFHSIGVDFKSPTLEQLKEKAIEDVSLINPILARNIHDHLIQLVKHEDLEYLTWKFELLEEMQIADLIMLKTLLENRKDLQQKTY